KVFGWKFQDYGPEYCSFFESGMDGGFFKSDQVSYANEGSVLVVLYSDDLERTQKTVVSAGGRIKKRTFEFPGGKRFHFSDPNGNEFAVWSDQ
ncbi:MAG: VOC family protein, partial [Kangiellaceae bacterium]|nr:VOC family protein [Kangiellaceae bacterium]